MKNVVPLRRTNWRCRSLGSQYRDSFCVLGSRWKAKAGTVAFDFLPIHPLLVTRHLPPRPDLYAVQCWASSRPIFFVMYLLSDCFFARHAEAELGPCTTAAPTTPNVIVFVSDIERSVRWYRDNVGLAEASEPDIAERHDSQVTVMARNRAGVALV